MEAGVYEAESEFEKDHWWFVGRRRLFARTISELGVSLQDPVIDLGSGTGSNLRLLQEIGFEHISAVEINPGAIAFCRDKKLPTPVLADVIETPYADGTFSLVLATDVVEHIDDDAAALREVLRVLRTGGRAILTVPAFESLWGLQDDVSHHRRRYRMKEFIAKAQSSGFVIRDAYYFNYLLFLPIFLARQLIKRIGTSKHSENEINTPFINQICSFVFGIDIATAPHLHVPFGVSILAVVEKP